MGTLSLCCCIERTACAAGKGIFAWTKRAAWRPVYILGLNAFVFLWAAVGPAVSTDN